MYLHLFLSRERLQDVILKIVFIFRLTALTKAYIHKALRQPSTVIIMPKTSATLTNCYVPLLISSDGSQKLSENFDPNKRKSGDGSTRGSKSLRRLCLDRSVLTASSGSSLVECGLTKVLCSVHGPRPAAASSLSGGKTEFHSSGVLNCVIR